MVKKIIQVLIIALTSLNGIQAQDRTKVYKTNNGDVSFFSETPVENIDAHAHTFISAINPENKNVAAVIILKSFKFKNALMEEHFNEKYLESDKFPKATFSGLINEDITYNKPGIYNITVTGKLNIHGVEQVRTIKGTITVDKNLNLNLISEFGVKLTDHKIDVPQLVFQKIAEVVIVKINANYLL